MISRWRNFLQERLEEWKLPTSGEWTFLFMNIYHPAGSNIDILWFHDGGAFPLVVTKLCREERILRWEFENLTRVHSCAADWAPKPLRLEKQGDFWALWMKGVPGSTFLPREYRPAVLKSLADTLASMHGAIRDHGGWSSPNRYDRMVKEPIENVAQFNNVASIAAGCAQLRTQLSPEWVASLPVIPQHGDLCQGNLLLDGDKWHVVDWENFGRVDMPLFDLISLLYAMLRGKGETPEIWDPVLVSEVPGLMASYTRKMGSDPADVSRMLPLTLIIWFHLQWRDGRQQFAGQIHKAIQHYFEHRELWEKVFVPPLRSEIVR